jgi:hypothetical protein
MPWPALVPGSAGSGRGRGAVADACDGDLTATFERCRTLVVATGFAERPAVCAFPCFEAGQSAGTPTACAGLPESCGSGCNACREGQIGNGRTRATGAGVRPVAGKRIAGGDTDAVTVGQRVSAPRVTGASRVVSGRPIAERTACEIPFHTDTRLGRCATSGPAAALVRDRCRGKTEGRTDGVETAVLAGRAAGVRERIAVHGARVVDPAAGKQEHRKHRRTPAPEVASAFTG